MKAIDWFLSKQCAGDVLSCVKLDDPYNEIVRSVAVVRTLREIVLARNDFPTVIDMYCDNMTAVLGAHLFSNKVSMFHAFGSRPYEEMLPALDRVTSFFYTPLKQCNTKHLLTIAGESAILVSSGAKGKQANDVVNFYNDNEVFKALVIAPRFMKEDPSWRDVIVYDEWIGDMKDVLFGKKHQHTFVAPLMRNVILEARR